MATQLQPETFAAWMRVIERRMSVQERRGSMSQDDVIALMDSDGGSGGGTGIPPGGTDGQVLTKQSSTDGDANWENVPTGKLLNGAPITGPITAVAGTYYPINLPASTGNVAITMPTAPAQGSVVAFVRLDSNVFTSTPRITAGVGDTIGDANPYVISMRNSFITFTYEGTTWWPTMPVGGASGMGGATPSSAFAPTLMSRDVNGRTQVEDPVAPKDVVNLEYLQAHGGGGSSDEVAIRPDDPTTPEPSAELWVDTDDTSGGLTGLPQSPLVAADLNTAIAPGFYWCPSSTNGPVAGRSYHLWVYAAQDTLTNVVQVAYRATSGLLYTNIEQWQRTGSGGAWSPWVPVRYDTGWKALPIASGYQAYGSSPAPAYRIKNDMVYYRGQIGKTDGSAFGATAFTAVNALPAEAQPTLATGGYVMTSLCTSTGATGGRMYIGASSPATITINMEATGALYVDIGTFFYPLN